MWDSTSAFCLQRFLPLGLRGVIPTKTPFSLSQLSGRLSRSLSVPSQVASTFLGLVFLVFGRDINVENRSIVSLVLRASIIRFVASADVNCFSGSPSAWSRTLSFLSFHISHAHSVIIIEYNLFAPALCLPFRSLILVRPDASTCPSQKLTGHVIYFSLNISFA